LSPRLRACPVRPSAAVLPNTKLKTITRKPAKQICSAFVAPGVAVIAAWRTIAPC
jgi:hypothetical protein